MRLSVPDVGLKLAALLLAGAFALHVRSVTGDVRIVVVSILMTPVPAGFEARVSPDTARVHIRATGADFQRLKASPPVIRIQPGRIPVPGRGTISLSSRDVSFRPGAFAGVVERVDPREVRVEIVPAPGAPETPGVP